MTLENLKLLAEIRHRIGKHLTDAGWLEGPLIDFETTVLAIFHGMKVLADNAKAISEALIAPDVSKALNGAPYARIIAAAAETGFDIFL